MASREVGTLARITEVLERFDDGRLNVLVEGGPAFSGRAAHARPVVHDGRRRAVEDGSGPVDAETSSRAAGAFRALAVLGGRRGGGSRRELAAALLRARGNKVELVPDAKQQLLESLSSRSGSSSSPSCSMRCAKTMIATGAKLGDRAKRNGSRLAD